MTHDYDLTPDEISTLLEALYTHLNQQLPGELFSGSSPKEKRAHARRVRMCKRLVDDLQTSRVTRYHFTSAQRSEIAEALDSHFYWSISDPDDRDSGFVNWEENTNKDYRLRCSLFVSFASRFGADLG